MSHIGTVTFDFGNAEWSDVGHISRASSFTATAVFVAQFIAPSVVDRAAARGIIANNKAL